MRKALCMALAAISVVSCLTINSSAMVQENMGGEVMSVQATGNFALELPSRATKLAGESFLLATGESVRVVASFTPTYANLDFGLIDEDGVFYSVRATGGSIDQEILIEESGEYIFAVRNNSYIAVEVSGTVRY